MDQTTLIGALHDFDSDSLTVDWGHWAGHFRRNANRPFPEIRDPAFGLTRQTRCFVARSLAIFQLGEAGEGRIAKEIDSVALYGVDENYREALKLFVREEGRHARILSDCVTQLGGELIQSNWTERLFRTGRRLLGVRLKLLVLLVAEVVGICFYRKLADKLPPGGIRRALMQIISDERKHLRFHAKFFGIRVRNELSRLLFVFLWRALALAACASVLWDHRATFQVLRISFREAIAKFSKLTLVTERRITQWNSQVSEFREEPWFKYSGSGQPDERG